MEVGCGSKLAAPPDPSTNPLERPWAFSALASKQPDLQKRTGSVTHRVMFLWLLCPAAPQSTQENPPLQGGPYRSSASSSSSVKAPPSTTASSRKGRNETRLVRRASSPSAVAAPQESTRIRPPSPASSPVSLSLPPLLPQNLHTWTPLPPPKTLAGSGLPGCYSDRPLPRAFVDQSRFDFVLPPRIKIACPVEASGG